MTELNDDEKFNLFKFSNTNKPKSLNKLYLYEGSEEVEPFSSFVSLEFIKRWIKNDIQKEDTTSENLEYDQFFEYEPRTGTKIDDLKGTVKEVDGLYRVNFLRLKEDIKILFWVEFDQDILKQKLQDKIQDQNVINFIYNFFNENPRVLKLGGEMKNVKYELNKDDFLNYLKTNLKIKDNITVNKGEAIEVLFLSYGVFDFDKRLPKIDKFEIVSACFDNYINIGIKKETKIKRAIPLGSIISLKAIENKKLSTLSFIVKQNNNSYSFISPENINNLNWEFIGSNLVLIKKVNN